MLIGFDDKYFDTCAEIYFTMFTAPEWDFHWLTLNNARRYLRDVVAAPRFRGFIFMYENRAAGFCLGEVSDYFSAAQYRIREIFIDPILQGKGHGSAFLADIEADLKQSGIDIIVLSTSKSVRAFKFYLKNGYIVSQETVFLVKPLQ